MYTDFNLHSSNNYNNQYLFSHGKRQNAISKNDIVRTSSVVEKEG